MGLMLKTRILLTDRTLYLALILHMGAPLVRLCSAHIMNQEIYKSIRFLLENGADVENSVERLTLVTPFQTLLPSVIPDPRDNVGLKLVLFKLLLQKG